MAQWKDRAKTILLHITTYHHNSCKLKHKTNYHGQGFIYLVNDNDNKYLMEFFASQLLHLLR